jgi:murein DD-endopeptidase MepM/ murein hydrolase activator NlpD
MRPLVRLGALPAALLIAVGGCETVEEVAVRWAPASPHAAYLAGLHEAGLQNTALAREWVAEAAEAIAEPQPVELPFREATFIAPEDPEALGYRFTLDRGRRLTVRLQVDSEEDARVFLDFMRLPEDDDGLPRPVLTADTLPDGLTYEPYRRGDYVVRVQPELLRGGTFTLELEVEAALAFPVEGHDTRSIQSFFGADRDGGRRSHHGVDIFARRGTPVLASRPGEVRRANVTNLGGKVVWLRDEAMNRNLYYAHLDSQVVSPGDRVAIGDTLGFVGNTGNAITTPPHLHYGLYVRGEGPVDPLPFLSEPRGSAPLLQIDSDLLGRWVRVRNAGVNLRGGPDRRAPVVRELDALTPLRALGGNGTWLRARLPDGSRGYVAARLTEIAGEPVDEVTTASDLPVTAHPAEGAPVVETAPSGTPLAVLGRFGEFAWIRGPHGRTGWARLGGA